MKLVSTLLHDINLRKDNYHAFTFESSYLLKKFKQLLFDFFNNKPQSETEFLRLVDSNNKELKPKDFHFISFNCHHINLEIEKNTKTQIQKLLFHQLENNPQLISSFSNFQNQLSLFLDHLELEDEFLSVEFQYSEKAILNLIKALDIVINFENDGYVPNYKIRNFLIKALLKMNTTDKEPILVISHPETDIGYSEISIAIKLLKNLNITTIVLSSQNDFLTAASDDQFFLINQNGDFYDIINLRKELYEFGIVSEFLSDSLVRSIALYDFNESYELLNEELKGFLLSNKL